MQSRIVVCALLATLFAAAPARADGLEAARWLLMREKDDVAREAVIAWLMSDGPQQDYNGLEDVAQIGRYLKDIDILRRVRAVAEKIEEQFPDNQVIREALGYTYLGLAEENLRLQTGSRSISLYFADAKKRGERRHLLAAETRYAQGDLAGALKLLRDRRARWLEQNGAENEKYLGTSYEDFVLGGYEYEAASALPVDAAGRPSAEAQKGFAAAVKYLTWALGPEGDLFARQRRQALLWRAYCGHRTGHVERAEEDYISAYKPAKEGQPIPLALRGLSSLFLRDRARFAAALDKLADRGHDGHWLTDSRIRAHAARDPKAGLKLAEAWRDRDPTNPATWMAVGRTLEGMKRRGEAKRCYARVLGIDPAHQGATYAFEAMAREVASEDFDRCEALYEDLLRLKPEDPYIRNNYGFLLREWVSPHTDLLEGGLQKLKADAPPIALERLKRCAAVYAEAAALIDPAEDGNRDELAEWNLAGIVNDYGLILHYFEDVQDAERAEEQYLRVMKMTDWTFKDTYSPNLHRLYRYVLKGRLLSWYRAAREARTAVLKEARGPEGLTLVPDERKRAAAQRDLEGLRARILRELETDAEEDGLSRPPGDGSVPSGKEDENDR